MLGILYHFSPSLLLDGEKSTAPVDDGGVEGEFRRRWEFCRVFSEIVSISERAFSQPGRSTSEDCCNAMQTHWCKSSVTRNGKRPRDLLNPKAVKYMQSVFSIKDTISKKESREISALCGVTVTQVREFFSGQRSRVRKHVRLSKEKVVKSNASKASQDGSSTVSDPSMPIDQVPLNSVDPKTVEGVPSCSSQEEALPDIDNSDKTFLENIFNLMRKEETFSGQVKLMEWILQIHNSAVLYWFLTKGGLMILTTWLSQAALEEQTTVLLVIFKVLCHLPLHKALPVHMSAVLQTVNRLRFYRTSDISNRARVLLSRWSKLFVRSQALKKPTSMKSPNAAQKEIIQKQRTGEILSDESWQSKVDIPEEILALTFEGSEDSRKSEPPRTLKLLPASADDSNRRHIRSVSSPQTRERRKVLFVEQPGQKTSSRSPQVARAVPLMQGRPMSADDIQKAKMRAFFMQCKYGKSGSSSNDEQKRKMEDPMRPSTSLRSNSPLSSKPLVRLNEEKANSAVLASTVSPTKLVDINEQKSSLDHQESSQEKLMRNQTSWKTPSEMRINHLWRLGTGEKSKEVEVQIERIRREKETFYHSNQEIPPNPKEPWDLEIDYDDTLTPEIPTEQPPDADVMESLASPIDKGNSSDTSAATASATSKEYCHPAPASAPAPATSTGCAPEPDLELLAVLLQNPQLVFALTSGQGGSLTSADTVRVLDMIKASGIGLPGISSGMGGTAEEKVEVTSLPSPTPGSDHIMSGWRPELGKDRFSESVSVAYNSAVVTSSIPSLGKLPHGSPVQPQVPNQYFSSPYIPTTVPQQLQATFGAVLPERQLPSVTPFLNQQSSSTINEAVLPMKRFLHPSSAPQQPESRGLGQMHNVKPATISIELNPTKERLPTTALHPFRSQPRPHPPLLPNPPPIQPLHTTWPPNAAASGLQASVSSSRNVRQFTATSNHFQANQNNYNLLSRGNVGEPELEMWSPERSPERSPLNQSGWSFPEPRSDYGWNSRPDRSRQHNSGYKERSREGRRWRRRH
ncbi:homeobox protein LUMINIDEPENDENS-like isoform X2 [Macadamia integrifolia]|uniref:homeobox protein LUMINIDEPENDENS-like isoform X2 n=1 Tax=Macadamia integrifolia TaxID=60698 RepID=UPI001C533199|nr:homeobox protein LUMINIDEPENDENS-like isoform X2 [Macadamia integrifolia]